MVKLRLFVCLAGALLCVCRGANASQIAVGVDSVAEYIDGVAAVGVELANRGDEQTYRVRASVELPGFVSAELAPPAGLDVAESWDTVVDLDAAGLPDGRHVVVTRVAYEDGTGHSFSSLHATELLKGATPPDCRVDVSLSDASFRRSGSLRVQLRSASTAAVPVKVWLLLPRELQCNAPTTTVTLVAGERRELDFALLNVSARPASDYLVYAVMEADTPGLRDTRFASGSVRIAKPWYQCGVPRRVRVVGVILLLACFIVAQVLPIGRLRERKSRIPVWLPGGVLAVVYAFVLCQLPIGLLLADTTTVGGDTPAHSYMAARLAESLFGHGRVVCWADGWWCGFPLFQFYFTLPYVLIALLSRIIAFNVAFKLVSVLGILLLPLAAYGSGRLMKVPRPAPSLLALASLVLLFDRSNTMFGVNIYSTLAGMISNSLSFPLMLLFLGAFWRDFDQARFRVSTVLLLIAMLASHFFTSIMAAIVLPVMLTLKPAKGVKRGLPAAVAQGGVGVLCMAWWIVPLLAKRGFGIDFGVNWGLDFLHRLPPFGYAVPALAIVSLACAWKLRSRYIAIMGWMLLIATALFVWGYDYVSAVFVNVRLWPFMAWAALAMAATGAGALIARLKAPVLGTATVVAAVFAFGIGQPNHVRDWATWNYSGLERKPQYGVFERLVLPLQGTAGRLANDLHEDNNKYLGSSRVFECVPHLIGKPILEGGIVNSAAGSLFSYYVQGETSMHCLGYPTLVTPTTFNITNGTRHLELFNVKHFVARWEGTKTALENSPHWRKLGEHDYWQSYELTTHAGRYVFVPAREPIALVTDRWKEAGLEWIYTIDLLDQPYALAPGAASLPEEHFAERTDHETFVTHARKRRAGGSGSPGPLGTTDPITDEIVTADRIAFRTTAIGKPHIVKVTYFPNWRVRGADRVYMVTPCFMLVYPTEERVELRYGYTVADRVGHVLTMIGLAGLVLLGVRSRRRLTSWHSPSVSRG